MARSIELDFPDLRLRLQMPERQLMSAAARGMAKAHKKALRRGVDSTGRALARGEDGGKPLRDSGRLLKSIKGYTSKRRGRYNAVVGATGKRDDLGASLRGRNAGLLAIHIYGLRSEAKRPRNPSLMKLTRSLEEVAADAFERALAKAFARGRARLTRGRAASIRGLGARALGRSS